MPDPVAPARFAHPDDVKARYEGTIDAADTNPEGDPPGRVQLRIVDVEDELLALVPSLRDPDLSVAEPDRFRRARRLVVDKVLELWRNPQGATSTTSGMDGFTETTRLRGHNAPAAIFFTEAELNSVRKRKPRSRFGTIPVGPGAWGPSGRC